VRKSGNQLRITAQLIDSHSGTHLWSKTYDHDLTDVFKVQEEIAAAVSTALSVTLDVGNMSRAQGGTTNVEAFDKYLHAVDMLRKGGSPSPDALQLLREAVAIDPNFAIAWVALADVAWGTAAVSPDSAQALLDEQQSATDRVLALFPHSDWARAMVAQRLASQHKWVEAVATIETAPKLADCSRNSLNGQLGQVRKVVACMQQVVAGDPLNATTSSDWQVALDMAGRHAEAQAEYERYLKTFPYDNRTQDYALLRVLGRKGADPRQVRALFADFASHELPAMTLTRTLLQKLDDPQGARAAIRAGLDDPANQDTTRLLKIAYYADRFGDRDTALIALRRIVTERHGLDLSILWRDWDSGLRADLRFKQLLKDLKLADYFRSSGNWGDFCKPLGADDFECQ